MLFAKLAPGQTMPVIGIFTPKRSSILDFMPFLRLGVLSSCLLRLQPKYIMLLRVFSLKM